MAEVTPIKTAAEQALSLAYRGARATLPGNGAVATLRDDAFKRFDARGLPHRRIEEWKYTDLRALMRDAKPLAGPPDAKAKARAKKASKLLASVEARRLVFADGVFAPELSDLAQLEAGLTIGSLVDALTSGDQDVAGHLAKTPANGDVALALNTAFMGDGAVIRIADNTEIERPLALIFVTASESPVSIFTRSLIVAGAKARATVIESHEGSAGVGYQINTALQLVIGDGAKIDHIKLTAEADTALHVSTLMAELGAEVAYNDFAFNPSGAVVRNQMFVHCAGKNSIINLLGATLLRNKQHCDTTIIVDHAATGCQSREIFKSVLDDQSRGVFQGKIIVRPGAQKTDGKMMTRALLLSEDAEADSKPELEIFADDVQCGHGATVGALDKDLLFYLKARGIPDKEAESLLIQAFVGEAIEPIAHEGVKQAFMGAAVAWLAARN